MVSPSKAWRPDAPGSGGKVLRGRRRAGCASPYIRPEDSSPPPPSQAENPRWFSGIISGAGRLLSSMFHSDNEELPYPYSSDTEVGHSVTSDEDEDANASSEEFHELDESEGNPKTCIRCEDGPQSTSQRSERNLIIEQLLLQETFSRVECDRLVKIIQSRVVDTMDGGKGAGVKELPSNTVCSVMAFSGSFRPLKPERRSPIGLTYVANHLNHLSPRPIVSGAHSPELCEKAIMEAKNWIERKQSASASKCELDCGPCTLNTDTLHCLWEDEVGSPLDMAKSYMQALPSWQSPILSSTQFEATTSSGMHICEDKTPYTVSDHSFSTSKALKRSYHDADFDGTPQMHLKQMVNLPEPTISLQVDSSVRTLEHEAHQTRSAESERHLAVACANYESSFLPAMEVSKPVGTSTIILTELVEGGSSDEKIVEDLEESLPTVEDGNNVSLPDSTVIHNEPESLASESVKSSLLRDTGATKMRQDCRYSSVELLAEFGIRDNLVDSCMLLEENQKEAIPMSGYTMHGKPSFQPGADHCFPKLSNGGSTASMPVETSNIQTDASIHDSLKQSENDRTIKSIKQMLADSSGSRHGQGRKVAVKRRRGFASHVNSSFQPSSLKGDGCFPMSSNNGSAVAIPVESNKRSIDASIVPVGHATSDIRKKSERGTTTKSLTKDIIAKGSPSPRRGRGRKVAAKYRGRGRGK